VSTAPAAGARRPLVAAALLATFMQAVNISLPNAALPYIQGSLSMSDDEVGWIFSAYIAASAITMPMSNWLAARFGRKALFQTALGIFSLALVFDTLATTTLQFVFARIIQGAASGPLAPLAMAILLEETPPQGHARISTVWTVTSLLGMLSGPAIGGWLSEYHDWRTIFYLSLPLAAFIFLAMGFWLAEKKADKAPPFDFFGLAAFSVGIAGLQMTLDRGERLEWFASTEIWVEASASLLGFYFYAVHLLTRQTHFLNKALFRDRNFGLAALMYFALGFMLLPTLALTSPALEELLGYPADTAGIITIPRGAALIGAVILSWRVPAWLDNRLVLIGGMALALYGTWRMIAYSPLMDAWAVAAAGMLQGAGIGILMPALTRAAFSTLDPKLRPEGTLLFNLSRLYGSTIGIATVLLFLYDNTQSMHLALAKHLRPYGAAAHATRHLSGQALAMVNDMVTGQAAMVGVIDQFKLLLVVMLCVSPLILLLRKPHPGI
jgi:MFS transporter, DHA2 family, multidrug resistance protein